MVYTLETPSNLIGICLIARIWPTLACLYRNLLISDSVALRLLVQGSWNRNQTLREYQARGLPSLTSIWISSRFHWVDLSSSRTKATLVIRVLPPTISRLSTNLLFCLMESSNVLEVKGTYRICNKLRREFRSYNLSLCVVALFFGYLLPCPVNMPVLCHSSKSFSKMCCSLHCILGPDSQ